jgi:hypothetical protein
MNTAELLLGLQKEAKTDTHTKATKHRNSDITISKHFNEP